MANAVRQSQRRPSVGVTAVKSLRGRPHDGNVLPFGQGVIWSTAALVASVGAGIWSIRHDFGTSQDRLIVSVVLATASAVLALVGSVLCFTRFQMAKERTSLGSGIVLGLAGAGWILPARVGPMLRASSLEIVGGFAVGSSFMIALVVLTMLLLPENDSKLSIRRDLVWAGGGVVGVSAVVALGMDNLVRSSDSTSPAVGQLIAGPVLGAGACVLLLMGHRRQRGLLVYLGLGLLGLEAAEIFAINAPAIDSPGWLAASLVGFIATVTAMGGVLVDYRQGHDRYQEDLFAARLDFELSVKLASRERARHEETFHDLRSGLLGVEAVALTHQLREINDSGVLATELARLRGLASNKVGAAVSFDVVDLCAAIVELRLRRGEAVSLDASAGVLARTIPDDLTEVLGNLLDNASRHAPRSPATLRVRAEHGEIKISVLDRGPGVPADVVQKIFDRGFTTHSSGSGLGLYISREIVTRLGGYLTVAKRVGGGAEFAVVLPHFASTPNGDVGDNAVRSR